MRELLGDEVHELEASLLAEPVIGLRVNTLELTPADFRSISPWGLEPVPWCPTGFLVAPGERPGLHPFHAAGLYYLQEPSAMAAAQALAVRPGELVLDLAAAPGGKSTQLAAMLADEGLLVANDVNGARARELSRNMERWGSRVSLVTSEAPSALANHWGGVFDAVLLDAPCSGEGMFRKTGPALEQWTPQLVESCALRQEELLETAARLVRPGGRLVYSTCTFEPLENERVIAAFLDAHREWELAPTGLPGIDSGRPEWAGSFARAAELERAARIWPHRSSGEGHFVALLRRSPDSAASTRAAQGSRRRRRRARRAAMDGKQAAQAWDEFVEANLEREPFPRHQRLVREDGLYAVPPGSPDLEGLRALRPGVWLGSAERGRFVPSHALALALRREESRRSVDLEPDDPLLASYLMGAELELPGEDGWLLVTVGGHPLGWGRRSRGIVKNRYPKGLRRPPGG